MAEPIISPQSPDYLLTPQEAAQICNCTVRKLENDRYRGRGAAYLRDGNIVRYRRRDIEAWIEANMRRGSIAPPPRRGRPRKGAAAPASASLAEIVAG